MCPNVGRWVPDSDTTVGSTTLMEERRPSLLRADVDNSGYCLAAALEVFLDDEDEVVERGSKLAGESGLMMTSLRTVRGAASTELRLFLLDLGIDCRCPLLP